MESQTIIYSNGSKWAGQEADSIEKLIEVLKNETIEERFFKKFTIKISPLQVKVLNHCPISDFEGMTRFFGNFERLSHVFRIDTNDKILIEKLSIAIKENKGWKKYYSKNLISLTT